MSWGATQKTQQQQTSTQSQTNTPTEPGYMAAFRQSLVPGIQRMTALSQQPIFGDAAKSEYMGNLNDLANSSMKKLSSNLAGHGALDSGGFAAGASGIEQSRFGNAAQFFGSIPGLERQNQMSGLMQALGLGENLAGHAPVGNVSTGDSSSSGSSSSYSNPGLSGLVSALGGAAMGAFMPGLGALMGAGGKSLSSLPMGMSPTASSVMGQGSMFPGWGGGIQADSGGGSWNSNPFNRQYY